MGMKGSAWASDRKIPGIRWGNWAICLFSAGQNRSIVILHNQISCDIIFLSIKDENCWPRIGGYVKC